jgi:hypothetical protein
MICCAELENLVERGYARQARLSALDNGRILTEFDTDYFLVFGEDRPSYVGLHYCPFCGRILSRDLWNREKKK